MKKFFAFLTVALLATLSLSVSSCSDDDDKFVSATEESLIGTWQTDWCTYEDSGETYTERLTVTFESDGSVTEITEDAEDGVIDTERGVWSLSGANLTIRWSNDGEPEERECYISGDILKVVFKEFGQTFYLHRIS